MSQKISASRGNSSKSFKVNKQKGADFVTPELEGLFLSRDENEKKTRFELIVDHMRPAFKGLSLAQSDLDIIQQVFQNIDVSSSGSIDIKELEIFLKTDKDPFNRRVLALV
jgi:hypothetical protein